MRRAARRRSWPTLLLRSAVALVLCALGLAGSRALDRTNYLELSSDGATVVNAGSVLSEAEHTLRNLIRDRHGTSGSSGRCYFAAINDPSRTDRTRRYQLTGDVMCGPVAFVDADPDTPYLVLTTTTTSTAGRAHLLLAEPDRPDASASLAASILHMARGPAAGEVLVRPDGRMPGVVTTLVPPSPPPATANLLSTTATVAGPLRTAAANAVMIGPNSGLALKQFGFVSRFGTGADARSAPPGLRLFAFSVTQLPGELATKVPNLALQVDGAVRGPLVVTQDFVVTAVPSTPRQLDLLLTDAGTTQRLSLLSGQPAASNPLVASRSARSQSLTVSQVVTVRVSRAGKTGLVSGTVSFRAVWLTYWAADGSQPTDPARAFLHVSASVRLAGDPRAYGAEAGLLSATVPGEPYVGARNAAMNPKTEVDDVIEVPATVTTGAVRYSGRIAAAGTALTVLTPVTVPFSLPS